MNYYTQRIPEFNDSRRYEFLLWVPFYDEYSNIVGFTLVTFEKDYDNSVSIYDHDNMVNSADIEYFINENFS